jgi:hypothetical protein
MPLLGDCISLTAIKNDRVARMVVSGLRSAREEQRLRWLEKHPGKEGRREDIRGKKAGKGRGKD